MSGFKTIRTDSPIARATAAIANFISAPASAAPLAVFRMGVAAVLLFQAVSIAPNLLDLYGRRGIVQWQVMEPTVSGFAPRIWWFSKFFAGFGISDSATVQGLFLIYAAALTALLFGYRVRGAAAIAWLVHLTMKSSGTASIYGVDCFAQIALFYMLWMPVGAALSLDRAAGRASGEPTSWARLSLRVIQIHLCIMYLSCALEKGAGVDWWNGEAVWCSLQRHDLCTLGMDWIAGVPLVAQLAGWGTLLVEGGYVFLIWPRRTRTVWALATIGLHLGIAIFLRLVTFSAIMSVFTGSMFLVSAAPGAEFAVWKKVAAWARSRFGAWRGEGVCAAGLPLES